MGIFKFKIDGMTCESCAQKITEKLQSIPDVKFVKVDLSEKTASIDSFSVVKLSDVKESLSDLPKYTIREVDEENTKELDISKTNLADSKFVIYKPLILIFTYIFLASFGFQLYIGKFDLHVFMNHIMAGFFLGLSFFKFLDLTAFAESFAGYDPVAKKFLGYGFVYPFIELVLGLMFISQIGLKIANGLTVLVLGVTTIGVLRRLQSKSNIQCACLGSGFNLPLSYVTVFENVVMILMGAFALTR